MPKILPLTNSQVRILHCLSRNSDGLTREQIAEKTGVVVDAGTLGPVYDETLDSHPESLRSLRLVKIEKYSPDSPTLFVLTQAGVTAAEAYSSRKIGAKVKVDPKALDKAVKTVRLLKPYGLELFTEDDVKEVRALLPPEFQEVTVPDLRQQIVNRRKQGAYAQDRLQEPAWYEEYRESSDGKNFITRVLDYYGGCALCLTTKDVKVYHRMLENLGMERVKDGIALCASCRKRQGRFMCEIPETNPEDNAFGDEQDEGDSDS